MALRQLETACLSSSSFNSTCTSFSASAKVNGDTPGPTGAAVAKAGGDPGGGPSGDPAGPSPGFCSAPQEETAMPKRLSELCVRNSLRDFDMEPLMRILSKR
jgi:hypothetical protein